MTVVPLAFFDAELPPFPEPRAPRTSVRRPPRKWVARATMPFSWSAPQPAITRARTVSRLHALEARCRETAGAYAWMDAEIEAELPSVVVEELAPEPLAEFAPEPAEATPAPSQQRDTRTPQERQQRREWRDLLRSPAWTNFFELYEDSPLPPWAPLRMDAALARAVMGDVYTDSVVSDGDCTEIGDEQ